MHEQGPLMIVREPIYLSQRWIETAGIPLHDDYPVATCQDVVAHPRRWHAHTREATHRTVL